MVATVTGLTGAHAQRHAVAEPRIEPKLVRTRAQHSEDWTALSKVSERLANLRAVTKTHVQVRILTVSRNLKYLMIGMCTILFVCRAPCFLKFAFTLVLTSFATS